MWCPIISLGGSTRIYAPHVFFLSLLLPVHADAPTRIKISPELSEVLPFAVFQKEM